MWCNSTCSVIWSTTGDLKWRFVNAISFRVWLWLETMKTASCIALLHHSSYLKLWWDQTFHVWQRLISWERSLESSYSVHLLPLMSDSVITDVPMTWSRSSLMTDAKRSFQLTSWFGSRQARIRTSMKSNPFFKKHYSREILSRNGWFYWT